MNEPLPENLRNRWSNIAQEIWESTKMVFPRRYLPLSDTAKSLNLHVFADASIKAYGAVAYLCENGQSSLVIARTRVSPLKTKNTSQIRAYGSRCCCQTSQFIQSSLAPLYKDISIHLWSDSQIVLHWLHSHKKLKQFVASRIQEITELFSSTAWRYCPTVDNPADLLTRGINATSLAASMLWKHGQTWLIDDTQWPVWNYTEVLQLQVNTTNSKTQEITTGVERVTQAVGLHCIITISNYNNLDKLLAATAYVFQFATNVKQSTVKLNLLGSRTVNNRFFSRSLTT